MAIRSDNGLVVTCLVNRLSRRSTNTIHSGVSSSVDYVGPGRLVLSFGGISFVSSDNVKLIVNHCHLVRGRHNSIRVEGIAPRAGGVVRLTKLNEVTIVGRVGDDGGGRMWV